MIKSIKGVAPSALAKFQLFDAEEDKGESHYDWVKAHELNFDQAEMLFNYGREIGVEVFFSIFGVKYVEWCERIGVKRYKIAFCLYNDYNIYKEIYLTRKPIIMSVPLGYYMNGTTVMERLMGGAISDIPEPNYYPQLLYCVPNYPTQLDELHFNNVSFAVYSGFSDHTLNLVASRVAISRGAEIIEKHFCLEHNSLYPDNDWAMVPDELKELNRWENICHKVLNG